MLKDLITVPEVHVLSHVHVLLHLTSWCGLDLIGNPSLVRNVVILKGRCSRGEPGNVNLSVLCCHQASEPPWKTYG